MNDKSSSINRTVYTIEDIRNTYSKDDFNKIGENGLLRCQVLSPIFTDLQGKRIIYCERLVLSILEIKEIIISQERFSAQVERIQLIYDGRNNKAGKLAELSKWSFGASWSMIIFSFEKNEFYAPYANWRIWIDQHLVKQADILLKANEIDQILEFTIYNK